MVVMVTDVIVMILVMVVMVTYAIGTKYLALAIVTYDNLTWQFTLATDAIV